MSANEFALIEDGYSIDTVIPRVAGLHPAVKVRYRPALAEERHAWLMGADRDVGGKERVGRIVDMLTRHVEAWDVKTKRGAEVSPKNTEMVRRLQPTLQAKLLDLVLGYTPAQEEADEKNSLPASTS